jgi:hypothetical protein
MAKPGSEVGSMSANTVNFEPTVPTDILEAAASEQRVKLHDSISELRSQMHQALDVRQRAREYLVPASAVVAGLGLMMGFGMAGMFSRAPQPRSWRSY